MVANVARFTPYGLPSLIKSRGFYIGNGEPTHQIRHACIEFFLAVCTGSRSRVRHVSVGLQLQTKRGRLDHAAPFIRKIVVGTACGINGKVHHEPTVRRHQSVTGG